MILGRLLVGIAITAATAIAVAVTVKVVKSVLDRNKLANLARSEGIKSALVEEVERCDNRVTLKDLNSNRRVTYEGKGVSSDVKKGIII